MSTDLDDFISDLYDAGWEAPHDAQWENIEGVFAKWCTRQHPSKEQVIEAVRDRKPFVDAVEALEKLYRESDE
jgi:hypothetical protein